MRPKLTYANVVATLALFIALGGASYAALKLPKNSVGPKQLRKNAVRTAKVRNEAITAAKIKKGTLTGAQINLSTLGTVPMAESARSAAVAGSLTPHEPWHEVGAPGEPAFQHDWQNFGDGNNVAYYKDHEGIVHLKGHAGGDEPGFAIFQLPPGYRPPAGTILPFAVECNCPEQLGLVRIAGTFSGPTFDTFNGGVFGASGGTSINFGSIAFPAES
jgi:hypothetical protein